MSVISCKDLGTDVRVLLVDHDPKTVSTDCPKGTSIIDANGVWYRKRDDGDTTNVAKMGNFNDVTTYASLPGTGVEKETYLTVDTHSEYYWNGSGWVQVNVAEKRLGGIIVSKFGNSVPSEYKHATGAAVSTYERFQSGKDNAGGAGFAGASREWIAGDGGDAGGGDYDGGDAGDLLVRPGTGGALAGAGSDGAVGNFVVWDGTTKFFKVSRDGLTTISAPDIRNVSSDILVLENPTLADDTYTVQMSPRIRWHGSARNTAGGHTTETHDWIQEVLPATAAGATSSALKFGHSLNGAAYNYRMTLTSDGTLSGFATGTASTSFTTPTLNSLVNNATLTVQSRTFTAADSAVEMATGTMTQGDGMTFVGIMVRPTYSQSGTAAASDFVVSRRENSVGTGNQFLADFGTNTDGTYSTHSSKFYVTNAGTMIAGSSTATVHKIIGTNLQVWHGDEGSGDYIEVKHTAALGAINTQTGELHLQMGGVAKFKFTNTIFYPAVVNTHSFGAAGAPWLNGFVGQDTVTGPVSTSGLYLGLAQEARIRYNKDATGYPAACLILGLEAVGTAAKDRLAFSSATTIGQGFKALTNVDGSDTYIATQSALDNDKRGGNLYFELGAKHGTGADGIMYVYSGAVLIATFGNAEFGVFGSASAQAGHIADPTGGTTVDTEARAAIASLLTAIENYGLLAAA